METHKHSWHTAHGCQWQTVAVFILVLSTAVAATLWRAVVSTPPRQVLLTAHQQLFRVSVLPVNLTETADWLLKNHCCSPDDTLSQYATGPVLEQYVRGLSTYLADPMAADIVFVPLYPISYGLYGVFNPSRSVDATADDISKQVLPLIQQLPNTTVLVFVMGHVDGYPIIDRFFLQHIRQGNPRHIITLRTDMGNTVCKCFSRNYWGSGLENILVPYSVVQPVDFISAEARRAAPAQATSDRNITLYFNAAPRHEVSSHRGAIVASLHALQRSDLDVTLTPTPLIKHWEYVQRIRRSKFCLVPEGDVSTSLRLFEAIVAECVPVIISDCIDMPFKRVDFIGNYSSFAVQLPITANGSLIMDTIDGLVQSGGYEQLLAKLHAVWPYFAMHNGSLAQPSAGDLIMYEVYGAVERMRSGALLLSESEAHARMHVC